MAGDSPLAPQNSEMASKTGDGFIVASTAFQVVVAFISQYAPH
jgi:hypothetical protein